MTRILVPTLLLLAGFACGSPCAVDAPLDATDPDLWLCRGDVSDACDAPRTVHTVADDGSITSATLEPAEDPAVACFVVYPTLDLRLGAGLHHATARVERPAQWVRDQAALLRGVCDVWAPVYRQVTIGTYLGASDRKDLCFDSAYGDVDAAFTAFLDAIGDRPFAVFGHSQGGQHLSRLLHDVVEPDPALRARLVAAYPLGWALGTREGASTGGSFDALPVCTTAADPGCVVGYRSFHAGSDLPALGRFAEGDAQVCVHPAAPEDPATPRPLSALVAPAGDVLVRRPAGFDADADDLFRWPDAFDARCVGPPAERALQIRWARRDDPPVDLNGLALAGDNGTHILDVALGVEDVVADLARRTDAWARAE